MCVSFSFPRNLISFAFQIEIIIIERMGEWVIEWVSGCVWVSGVDEWNLWVTELVLEWKYSLDELVSGGLSEWVSDEYVHVSSSSVTRSTLPFFTSRVLQMWLKQVPVGLVVRKVDVEVIVTSSTLSFRAYRETLFHSLLYVSWNNILVTESLLWY